MLPFDEGTPEMGSSRSPSEVRKATRKHVSNNACIMSLDLDNHHPMEVGLRDGSNGQGYGRGGIEWWWHLYGGDGGGRNKAFLHMLCVLDSFLDVLFKCVKLVKFLLYLVSSHGWLRLSTQPTPREIDRWEIEKVKALGANGVMSGSRVGVVWMEVGGEIVRARVVSRVAVKVMWMVLRGWEVFERWFWMGELSLEEMSIKSVRGIFFGRFWVEELALEAMEYDDQGMGYGEGCLQVLWE
ncbi:hypothetical protein Tco_1484925 [Tanacetum coccineum]